MSTFGLCAALNTQRDEILMNKLMMFQRYVPFAAVAAANCVNIPLMRQNELINGIDVSDNNGNIIGESRVSLLMCHNALHYFFLCLN